MYFFTPPSISVPHPRGKPRYPTPDTRTPVLTVVLSVLIQRDEERQSIAQVRFASVHLDTLNESLLFHIGVQTLTLRVDRSVLVRRIADVLRRAGGGVVRGNRGVVSGNRGLLRIRVSRRASEYVNA